VTKTRTTKHQDTKDTRKALKYSANSFSVSTVFRRSEATVYFLIEATVDMRRLVIAKRNIPGHTKKQNLLVFLVILVVHAV
jgi:hypothetical protein